MTEQANAPVEQSTGQVMDSSTVSTPSAHVESTPAEKLIPQSEVGKIAGASRKEGHDKGYEKGYQDAYSKFQQQQVSPQAASPDSGYTATAQPQATQNTNNNLAEIVARQVEQTLKKERDEYTRVVEEKRQQDHFTQLGAQLRPKMEAAKEKYSDFDQAIADVHLEKIPNLPDLLEWVNSVSNAGDVLYDLAKNPHKIGILNSMHTPELARRQIQEISQSLQNNQTAQERPLARNPLSTVEPSNVGRSSEQLSGQQLTDHAKTKFRF